jgi:chromate transporter
LVTWFTFLPSFIFILAGGPLVESTQNNRLFTAPLSAITAAVVGVIFNLALFFAYHAFWPQGTAQGWLAQLDLAALAIGLIASTLLFYKKMGVMPVLGLCAVLGAIIKGMGIAGT